MATSPEPTVRLSVLDRLLDDGVGEIGNSTWLGSVEALKASLVRDLEWLLNTRQTPEPATDDYPELAKYLFNYGLPDFTSLSFDNPKDRVRLLRHLENTIRIFEPRLESPRIVPVAADPHSSNRIIRFQIEGLLKMDPAPEQVTFDTVLNLSSGEYSIKGDRTSA